MEGPGLSDGEGGVQLGGEPVLITAYAPHPQPAALVAAGADQVGVEVRDRRARHG